MRSDPTHRGRFARCHARPRRRDPDCARGSRARCLCAQVVDELGTAGADGPIELTCEREVRGAWDPHRLAQVVSNLISNAVQHGKGGQVRVDVRSDAREAMVRIQNQGEVPGELVDGLFVPFRTRPGGRVRGSGLGLPSVNVTCWVSISLRKAR